MILKGKYYDGKNSKPHEATIEYIDGVVMIQYEDFGKKSVVWYRDYIKFQDYENRLFHFSYQMKDTEESFEVAFQNKEDYNLARQNFKELLSDVSSKILHHKMKAILPMGLFVLGFIGLCYFYLIPMAAERIAASLSTTLEEDLGTKLHSSITTELTVDSIGSLKLQDYYKTLKHQTAYHYNFFVINDEDNTLNAFAIPGGRIYVYRSMINSMDGYHQLSALLYHEIGHVENKHSIKNIFRTLSRTLFITMITSDLSGVFNFIAENANLLYTLKYSKELEREADDYALAQLQKSNTDIDGMVNLFQILQKESGGLEIPEFLSTHPLSDERIKKAQEAKRNQKAYSEDLSKKYAFDLLRDHTDSIPEFKPVRKVITK